MDGSLLCEHRKVGLSRASRLQQSQQGSKFTPLVHPHRGLCEYVTSRLLVLPLLAFLGVRHLARCRATGHGEVRSYTLGQAVQGDMSHFQRDNRNISISVPFQSNRTVNEIILANCCVNKVSLCGICICSIWEMVCAEPCQSKQELKALLLDSIILQFIKLTHSLPVSWLLLWTSNKENKQDPNWSDTYLAFSLRTIRHEHRRRQLNPRLLCVTSQEPFSWGQPKATCSSAEAGIPVLREGLGSLTDAFPLVALFQEPIAFWGQSACL